MSENQERRGTDRREGERREAPRRSEDRRSHQVYAGAWAICGALVVLYLFLVAIGSVRPNNAPAVSIVALVLGLAWLAHSWRRLWAGGYSPVADRERRGF